MASQWRSEEYLEPLHCFSNYDGFTLTIRPYSLSPNMVLNTMKAFGQLCIPIASTSSSFPATPVLRYTFRICVFTVSPDTYSSCAISERVRPFSRSARTSSSRRVRSNVRAARAHRDSTESSPSRYRSTSARSSSILCRSTSSSRPHVLLRNEPAAIEHPHRTTANAADAALPYASLKARHPRPLRRKRRPDKTRAADLPWTARQSTRHELWRSIRRKT